MSEPAVQGVPDPTAGEWSGPLRVEARTLTGAAWAPYGWLPVDDTDPSDGEGRLHFEWADPHVNVIAHFRHEVPETPDGYLCEMLYRHATHTQVLMPLDHPCVIGVAPPGADVREEGANELSAFVVPVLEPFVLHRGTWHWGPFPIAHDSVRLFNVQGFGYVDDNEMADLAAAGRVVEIVFGRASAGVEHGTRTRRAV